MAYELTYNVFSVSTENTSIQVDIGNGVIANAEVPSLVVQLKSADERAGNGVVKVALYNQTTSDVFEEGGQVTATFAKIGA